jgi:hypothetical protein
MIPLIDSPRRRDFNGGVVEKSSGHFLTAFVVDPISSPVNGQIIVFTR